MNLQDRNQKQRNFFNEKIDTYEEVHSSYREVKKELALCLEKNTKKILDLGGGTGLELMEIMNRFPQAEVTVIDISEKMLEKLKQKRFSDRVTTICGDFFEVDFGEQYDAVISTSALHHFKMEEKEILYQKIYQCLKENGQWINCDKVATTAKEEKEMLYEQEHHMEEHKHIDTPLTVEHEVEILEKVGFKIVQIKDTVKEEYKLIEAKKETTQK